jgi:hypothetical protein
MTTNIITKEEKRTIIERYENGEKIMDIAKSIKRSKSGVTNVLVEAKIPRRSKDTERRKHFFNFDFFKEINTEEKAYFLGLLYADGYISPNGNQTSISLQEEDVDILEKFKENTGFTGNLEYIVRPKPRKNMCKLTFSSKDFATHLKNKGCQNKKSLILKFPSEKMVPKNLIKYFILGYFDGDGGVAYGKNKVLRATFTGTKSFLKKVKLFFKENNIDFGSISEKTNSKGVFDLQYGSSFPAAKVLSFLYAKSNIFMKRKKNKFILVLNELKNKNIKYHKQLCPILQEINN